MLFKVKVSRFQDTCSCSFFFGGGGGGGGVHQITKVYLKHSYLSDFFIRRLKIGMPMQPIKGYKYPGHFMQKISFYRLLSTTVMIAQVPFWWEILSQACSPCYCKCPTPNGARLSAGMGDVHGFLTMPRLPVISNNHYWLGGFTQFAAEISKNLGALLKLICSR